VRRHPHGDDVDHGHDGAAQVLGGQCCKYFC
jgi:hypothetical protein